MKLTFRIILAPLWVPMWLAFRIVRGFPVFIVWLTTEDTWKQTEDALWRNGW